MRQHRYRMNGFTIVELIVVVAVIAILVAITIVVYGNWRPSNVRTVIESDLKAAVTSMENAVNFSNQYPASLPDTFNASEGTVVAGGGISGINNYCIQATREGLSYFMTKQKVLLPGTCPMLYYSPSISQSYTKGETKINDMSGNGVQATLGQAGAADTIGPTYLPDEAGGVMQFDGNDKYYASTNTTFGPSTTWTACVKTTANASSHNMFMGRYLPYFGSYLNGTSIIFSNRISGSQRTVSSTSPAIPLNTWHCYAFTTSYDGSSTTMSIYMDGALRTSNSFPGQQDNLAYPFAVGDGYNSTASPYAWYPFTGQIGDVAVYPRTLSASEIKNVYEFHREKLGI